LAVRVKIRVKSRSSNKSLEITILVNGGQRALSHVLSSMKMQLENLVYGLLAMVEFLKSRKPPL
jgi:hypothetical protein